MLAIAKRTGLGALIFMIIPLSVWVSGWQWHPDNEAWWWRALFWVTQTVTAPWGVLSSLVLGGWFLWCLRYRWRQALALAGILLAVLLLGQGAKSIIKNGVREPRPYVVWMAGNYGMNERAFYALPRHARGQWVKDALEQQKRIPDWLRRHWQHETGFAFPSGHSVFAASWGLLALGLLWPRRHYKTAFVVMLWSAMVMISRLVLGMHWPRDVAMGIALAFMLVTSACWLAQCLIGPLSPAPEETGNLRRPESRRAG
ncbi:phosphatidylglycerophosphatase B [Martelella alba]|uniref:Phosphatidylglycerophosphatase B n=1 Tax=Martelella alba TaxID=2590451 RepID=A0ABY2SPT7_9HYPH|nr:phosphatidylglycerophosphatase B [Martelella alba]TKI08114.1 phosphatidylglycerophosphatase B [Martelella alba]